MRKHDLDRKGYVIDLNIRYTFAKRSVVLVVPIELWATARNSTVPALRGAMVGPMPART